MSKVEVFADLYNQLSQYVKSINSKAVMPSLAETILFLNTIADLECNADALEQKYKSQVPFYEKASSQAKDKVKRYLNAMIELLQE